MGRSFCPVGVDSQASIPVVAPWRTWHFIGSDSSELSVCPQEAAATYATIVGPWGCQSTADLSILALISLATYRMMVDDIPNANVHYIHITSQLLLIMSLSYPYHCWRQFTGWRHISSVLSSLHHFFPKRLAAMAAFPQQPQSIAIIGGGVAGLQALRALENLPELEKIVSYPLKTMDGTQHDWIILDRSSLFFSCRRWFVSSCSFNSHELTLTSTSSNIYYRSIAYEVLTWDDMGQFAPNWPNLDGFPLFCWSNFYVFWCWLFVVRWIPCFPPTSQ